MTKICKLSGKKTVIGHRVSHSQHKTKRSFRANVHIVRRVNPATGAIVRMALSSHAMRTLSKWDAEGKKYDLQALANQ